MSKRSVAAVTVILLSLSVSVSLADDAGQAREILAATGVKGGLIVHLGCVDGSLTTALRANGRYRVHGLSTDAAAVAAARAHVRKAGRAGDVWIDPLAGARLPYAENMVNLLVAEDLGAVSMDEVLRVLVPRGVAYIRKGGSPGLRSLGEGGWVKTVKPRPADIDEWTHWLHGADGNAVAQDRLAGPPRRFQWVAGPLWSRSHDSVPSVTAFVSAGGRLFAMVDEAPASMDGSAPDKWFLVARDAFNGLELWRKPIPEWGWKTWSPSHTVRFTIPTHMPRRLVAVGDRVYATLGFNAPLTELDAATGEVLRTFAGTKYTDEILCVDGRLIVAINKGAQKPGPRKEESPAPIRKCVAAIDTRSGKMLWKTGDYVGLRSKTGAMERISHLSMAAGGGAVYFVDGDQLISLNLTDGSEKWRIARPEVPEHKMRYDIRITDMTTLVYGKGTVFFAQLDPDRKIDWREIRGKVHAFSAATGKELWSRPCSSWGWAHPADVFLFDDLVWVTGYQDDLVLGMDPATGAVKRKVSNKKAFDNGHHHRCYRNKATPRFMLTSFRGLEFIDWESAETDRNHWVRGTCRLGMLPANGMIYATPHPCDCYISSKLNGFLALGPAGGSDPVATTTALQKGPAYGSNPQSSFAKASEDKSEIHNPKSSHWPTYRHDTNRSGATDADIPASLKTVWQVDLGGAVTSPVIADGRVIVACKASRDVVCLGAADGREQWRFAPSGRLDTPPTISGGRVVFGCSGGYVTCLRATDGAMVWRFRAAPRERLVGAFGATESAWPVHGSVLIVDDVVYCTAGRSSFLDGGIYAYALKLDTGEVVAREQISSVQDMDVNFGRGQSIDTGMLSDLLVAHEGGVYMRQRPLFGKSEKSGIARHLHATGGMLDSSWFHRTRWFLGGAPFAEYLVYNDGGVCGVRARKKPGGYGGLFAPGGKGFELFAADHVPPPSRRGEAAPAAKPKPIPKGAGKKTGRPGGSSGPKYVRVPKDRWAVNIPVRATAMVLAGEKLVVAGTPDVLVKGDAWAAYEGRKGGRLLVVSVASGKIATQLKLASPPVLDGLAVTEGRLFLSTADGKVTCLGGK
jgi:outer membrane protein assembly factor BamB